MPPSGIRTHNLSRRAATEPRLRPCSHWDWHNTRVIHKNILDQLKCKFVKKNFLAASPSNNSGVGHGMSSYLQYEDHEKAVILSTSLMMQTELVLSSSVKLYHDFDRITDTCILYENSLADSTGM